MSGGSFCCEEGADFSLGIKSSVLLYISDVIRFWNREGVGLKEVSSGFFKRWVMFRVPRGAGPAGGEARGCRGWETVGGGADLLELVGGGALGLRGGLAWAARGPLLSWQWKGGGGLGSWMQGASEDGVFLL